MSDYTRRADDMRITKIENVLEDVRKDMVLVREKIFDGYDHSIKSTENKVTYIDEQNKEDHKTLRDDIHRLSGKFDKLLWALVSISFFLLVGEGIRFIL